MEWTSGEEEGRRGGLLRVRLSREVEAGEGSLREWTTHQQGHHSPSEAIHPLLPSIHCIIQPTLRFFNTTHHNSTLLRAIALLTASSSPPTASPSIACHRSFHFIGCRL